MTSVKFLFLSFSITSASRVDIFSVGLGLLRANILITALSMLAGRFARYLVWGWLTGLVF